MRYLQRSVCKKNAIIPIIWGLVLFIINIKGDAIYSISEFLNLFYLNIGVIIYLNHEAKKAMETKIYARTCFDNSTDL